MKQHPTLGREKLAGSLSRMAVSLGQADLRSCCPTEWGASDFTSKCLEAFTYETDLIRVAAPGLWCELNKQMCKAKHNDTVTTANIFIIMTTTTPALTGEHRWDEDCLLLSLLQLVLLLLPWRPYPQVTQEYESWGLLFPHERSLSLLSP